MPRTQEEDASVQASDSSAGTQSVRVAGVRLTKRASGVVGALVAALLGLAAVIVTGMSGLNAGGVVGMLAFVGWRAGEGLVARRPWEADG